MVSYIKDNKYVITKLLLNQFGAAIMGFILSFNVWNSKPWLNILVSVFCVSFYLVIQYTSMWDIGARDIIRVEGNRLAYRPYTGIVMALVANIPNFVLAFFVTIGLLFGTSAADGGFTNVKILGDIGGIAGLIALGWESMYDGLINACMPAKKSLEVLILPPLYWLIPFPAIIAAGLGYFAGLKNFQIIKTKKKSK